MEVYQSVLLIWSALETSPATARWQNFSYPTLMIFKKNFQSPMSFYLTVNLESRIYKAVAFPFSHALVLPNDL